MVAFAPVVWVEGRAGRAGALLACGCPSKVHSCIGADASSSEVGAPSNLPIPRIAEAIVVSFPQSNSEALSSSEGSNVVSRKVSSSGDSLALSSNKVLCNGAVAGDPFNGACSGVLFNGVVFDDPCNGAPVRNLLYNLILVRSIVLR